MKLIYIGSNTLVKMMQENREDVLNGFQTIAVFFLGLKDYNKS